jgi:hypothetical protein
MKVLGIEMKANEANICLLEQTGQLFGLPDCRTRKLNFVDINSAEQLRSFQFAVKKLVEDYGVEKIVIKQRQPKGKFAGSAHGFKMEAAADADLLCRHRFEDVPRASLYHRLCRLLVGQVRPQEGASCWRALNTPICEERYETLSYRRDGR